MRERLEMVGGHFDVESAPGKGTIITARIPSGKPREKTREGELLKASGDTKLESP